MSTNSKKPARNPANDEWGDRREYGDNKRYKREKRPSSPNRRNGE